MNDHLRMVIIGHISSHAPVLRGAARHSLVNTLLMIIRGAGFQSTHPCGVQLGRKYLIVTKQQFQSTHPLKGATVSPRLPRGYRLFQSTHPCWVRQVLYPQSSSHSTFQSTHPLKVRRVTNSAPKFVILFQSTHLI